MPSLIRIGQEWFFGKQHHWLISHFDKELKLRKWNGNGYRRVWTQPGKRGYDRHQRLCQIMFTQIRLG